MAQTLIDDVFDVLPLEIDAQTKSVSCTSLPNNKALQNELAQLNTLHRALLGIETPNHIPPPPVPANPKRSANVYKLRDTGNAHYRNGKYEDAIKVYTLGLQMAMQRPLWEPQHLVRDEASVLYSNRAQAYMALQGWAEGAVDAEASVEVKPIGNAKAWWRRGKCLMEMGRLEEAREWVGRALEVEGEEDELKALMSDIKARLDKA